MFDSYELAILVWVGIIFGWNGMGMHRRHRAPASGPRCWIPSTIPLSHGIVILLRHRIWNGAWGDPGQRKIRWESLEDSMSYKRILDKFVDDRIKGNMRLIVYLILILLWYIYIYEWKSKSCGTAIFETSIHPLIHPCSLVPTFSGFYVL